jgi:CheY-like chemotaxis protein
MLPAAYEGRSFADAFPTAPELKQCATSGSALQLEVEDAPVQLCGPVLTVEFGFFLALKVVPLPSLQWCGSMRMDDFTPGDPAVPMMMLAGVQAALIEESKANALDLAAERLRTIELLDRVTAAAANTSHELNNLVSTIGLTCERLLRGTVRAEGTDELVEIIRATAFRGAALTRQLMDLAERPEEKERLTSTIDGRPNAGCPAAAQLRVLVVEDERHALEALVELLQHLGYAVTACESAEAALSELAAQEFDVLLTDVILPGMNGLELSERAQSGNSLMAVVLMSGYLPEAGILRQGWLFLRKPLDLDQLNGLLRNAANERRAALSP